VGEREDFPGLKGGCRGDRAVPCIFQGLTDMAADAWFVIDNKDECHRPQRYTLPAAERGNEPLRVVCQSGWQEEEAE